jgi:hypothetical protein
MNERVERLKLLVELFDEFVLPVLAEQVQDLVSTIIRTPIDGNSIYAVEFKKGICNGLEMASGLPKTLLEQAEMDIEKELRNAETGTGR